MADAASFYLVPIGEVDVTVPGEDEAGSVNLDFNRNGELVGIEVLSARRSLPAEFLKDAERID